MRGEKRRRASLAAAVQMTPVATNLNDIRDIKPPVAIPSGWEWLWWVFAALAIIALAIFAWKLWQKHRLQIPVEPPVPAHIRAKQKLQEALALITRPEPFCVLVSDTIRTYLEERFDFRAPERTTEEFLHELRGTDLLSAEQKEKLGEFLERCDLVKFAKYEPREPELRDLHGSALRLVEETMPAITPTENEQPIKHEPLVYPVKSNSTPPKGKILAIIGTALQLAPFIWVIAYLVTLFRLLNLANNPQPVDLNHPFEAFNATMSKMNSILGDGAVLLLIGLLVGIVGLILLIIALTVSRYRAEWFFWFLLIYGLILCAGFPIGTAFGIFFLVYCLTKRREFLNRS